MSSTELAVSPKKKSTKQKMEQIVSSDDDESSSNGVTNGCNLECSESNNEEEEQQQAADNSNKTNDCVVVDVDVDDVTNPMSETNSVSSEVAADEGPETPQADEGGGGGFIKSNLSLNLNEILATSDDKSALPKNKKFLESSDDQIINQIFFQTITVTPTTDDDVLNDCKFLSSDNTPLTPNSEAELLVGPADFFNRKIDEDETFDTTFTDTADNYQENDGNLCSLNDNFNDNYCSFSSIDYNAPDGNRTPTQQSPQESDLLLAADSFLDTYAEQMRSQRPSIVIDCYDSDSSEKNDSNNDEPAAAANSNEEEEEEEEVVVAGSEKINDYCFYFDQTIEEDDDDACYISGSGIDDENESSAALDGALNGFEMMSTAMPIANVANESLITTTNGKAEIAQEEEQEELLDECLEPNDELLFNDAAVVDDVDKSLASEEELEDEDEEEEGEAADDDDGDDDDEGVINESCISVNVSSLASNHYAFPTH